MLKITLAALVLLSAQDPPKIPDNSKHLKKLDWMIGDWVGKGEMKGMGKYTEEMSFHWTHNKNFIKADQKVISVAWS